MREMILPSNDKLEVKGRNMMNDLKILEILKGTCVAELIEVVAP